MIESRRNPSATPALNLRRRDAAFPGAFHGRQGRDATANRPWHSGSPARSLDPGQTKLRQLFRTWIFSLPLRNRDSHRPHTSTSHQALAAIDCPCNPFSWPTKHSDSTASATFFRQFTSAQAYLQRQLSIGEDSAVSSEPNQFEFCTLVL